jgi:flagellar hook assembly protein FlgD
MSQEHKKVVASAKTGLLIFVLTTMALGIWSFYVLLHQENVNRMYLRVETDKSSYKVGDEVQITITYVNDQNVGVSLPSLSYEIEISNPQGVVFIMMTRQIAEGPVYIDPFSKQFVASYTWNQKAMDRNQVPKGTYTIRVGLSDSTVSGANTISIG